MKLTDGEFDQIIAAANAAVIEMARGRELSNPVDTVTDPDTGIRYPIIRNMVTGSFESVGCSDTDTEFGRLCSLGQWRELRRFLNRRRARS